MNYKNIINRLNLAIDNIEKSNFISNYPNIIEDLNYIYFDLDEERSKLNNKEQFIYGADIENKIMEYFAKFTKHYLKIFYNANIDIERSEESSMSIANAGYDSKQDKIKYSSFGMSLGRINKTSYIQIFLHESRHKLQYDVYKTTNIENVLNFSGNSIILIKEKIYKSLNSDNNRMFYQDNYNFLYAETDAEKFSLDELNIIIMNMYNNYISNAQNKNQKVEKSLMLKTAKVHRKIGQDRLEIKSTQQKQGRLNSIIIEELSREKSINSSYNVQGIEVDKLIELDKTIKKHPELQEQMPLLKLLFNGNTPKTYKEILADRQNLLVTHPQYEDEINKLYSNIIKTDPILYLTDLVIHNETILIEDFLRMHQTIFNEYSEEIQYICSLSNNDEIITCLTTNNNKKR